LKAKKYRPPPKIFHACSQVTAGQIAEPLDIPQGDGHAVAFLSGATWFGPMGMAVDWRDLCEQASKEQIPRN
jgi:hypothetical protein